MHLATFFRYLAGFKTAKTKITYYNVRCEFSEQHQHEGFKKILQ